MRSRLNFLFVVLIGAACSKPADTPRSTESGDPATWQQYVYNSDTSLTLTPPDRWINRFRTDTLPTVERGTALPGALNLVYVPVDSTAIPQTLVVVAMYDSVAWRAVKAEGGPPPGDSVMTHNGRVYVLSLPQSNPFEAGSADALAFDSLALTAAEKTRLIKVP